MTRLLTRSLRTNFLLALGLFALAWCSAARAAEDFVEITPGADLGGWVAEGTKDYEAGSTRKPVWSLQGDTILCDGRGFGFLRYDRKVCDFIFQAEYRMGKGCNSGLGIRTVKFNGKKESRPSYASYEIQILDDAGKKPNEHSSMSLYRYVAATSNAVKPAGEWNTLEVRCLGPKIQITLNGRVVQDVDQSTVETIQDKPLCGYISLQNHGKKIEWRKLRLKNLDAQASKPPVQKVSTQKASAVAATPSPSVLTLELRSRKQKDGGGEWQEHATSQPLAAKETAVIICDMWDKHWCENASIRCDGLAKKMAPLIDQLRAQGVHIIHCPSDTLDFYKDSPARLRAISAPKSEPPFKLERWCYLDPKTEAPLPVDDTNGGCDDAMPVKSYKAWSRQHPAISVRDEDVVSENGVEVYNYLKQHGIKNLLYVGVHTNMCVLGRSFGIRQMKRLGFNTILVRDLTDALYDPDSPPKISQAEGTELIIQHVEKYWCPTTTSASLASPSTTMTLKSTASE